jgi:hypothetical protein
LLALVAGQKVLDEQPGPTSVPSLLWRAFRQIEFRRRAAGLAMNLRQEADATVLRGLLALEEGEADEAEVAFRVALASWKDEATEASGGGVEFNGRVIAQECLGWLAQ